MEKTVISDKKRTLIFINIVISCIASSLLATALTTAMLPITEDLNVTVTTGQWMTSGYSLMMAIIMPLTAFLITRFPTKRLYASAIFIFLAGLSICAFSVNFPMMMVGRLCQAAGNGMLTSMAQVIILTIYPPEKKGTAMGWYGLSIGAAPVVAPTLAGLIVDNLGWRFIFYIAMAIMLISFIYCLIVFENVLDTAQRKFDVLSFIISAFAFGGITLGIGNIGSYGFTSLPVIAPLAIGIIAAALFSVRQFHIDEPFLELRILKDRDYTVSVLGSMLLYLNIYGATVILPLYVQQTLGMSATIAGFLTLPGSLVSAVISPFVGRIYDRMGMRLLFIGGSILLAVSNILMCFVTIDTGLWVAIALNILRNIAIPAMLMPLVTWGASTVTTEMTSHATALLTSLRTIGGSIGTAVFVAVMSMTAVSASAAGAAEAQASMHGVNMAFLGMFLSDLVMIVMAVWSTWPRAQEKRIEI